MALQVRGIQRLIQLLMLFLSAAVPCLAQETSAWDFYLGYSHRRAETREYFRTSPIIYAFRGRDVNFNGAEASVTENRNHWFGGTLDFSFYDKTSVAAGTTPQLATTSNRRRMYSILYGPRFSYRTSWITPFAHVLLGAAHATVSVTPVGPRVSDTSFATAIGGGVDVRIKGKLAVRVIQADYFRSDLAGTSPNGYRASAGVILMLGRR